MPHNIVAPEPNGSQTIDIMLSLLKASFGIDKQQLALDQPLDSLGLDSLAFMEYLFELEKALNITLSDVPRDVETVGALVAFIDSEVKRQSSNKSPT
jgi:acyl carrier protein